MSERISEILEVLRDISELYEPGMSKGKVSALRLEAMNRVAQRRKIQATTVSDKFRRRLRPAIDGTQQFDDVMYNWLNSRTLELQRALEKSAGDSDDRTRIHDFFEDDPLRKQIDEDLAALREEETGTEGGRKLSLVSIFERRSELRTRAIAIHGTTCIVCGFNFEVAYGKHGKNYIEVHHVVPVSTLTEPSAISPKNDMAVLCSNCHRMVHRKRDTPLSIVDLTKIVQSRLR